MLTLDQQLIAREEGWKIVSGDPLYLKAIKTLAKRRLLYGDQ